MRILVAEDDAEMRCLVVEALRRDGHDIFEAVDGRQLFNAVATSRDGSSQTPSVDLILSDVRMPVCNALDVLEELAGARPCPPLVLMTAFPNDETRRRAERLGALVLEKPLSMETLRAAVGRFVGRELR